MKHARGALRSVHDLETLLAEVVDSKQPMNLFLTWSDGLTTFPLVSSCIIADRQLKRIRSSRSSDGRAYTYDVEAEGSEGGILNLDSVFGETTMEYLFTNYWDAYAYSLKRKMKA